MANFSFIKDLRNVPYTKGTLNFSKGQVIGAGIQNCRDIYVSNGKSHICDIIYGYKDPNYGNKIYFANIDITSLQFVSGTQDEYNELIKLDTSILKTLMPNYRKPVAHLSVGTPQAVPPKTVKTVGGVSQQTPTQTPTQAQAETPTEVKNEVVNASTNTGFMSNPNLNKILIVAGVAAVLILAITNVKSVKSIIK